jgi:hypothetical protein
MMSEIEAYNQAREALDQTPSPVGDNNDEYLYRLGVVLVAEDKLYGRR